jgi:hypothetical protein
VAGNDAYATLVLSLKKNSPALKKRIPFPDYKSKSATTYAKSPYRVYEIYGTRFQARTIEASYTLLCAFQNGGNCPAGMPSCI